MSVKVVLVVVTTEGVTTRYCTPQRRFRVGGAFVMRKWHPPAQREHRSQSDGHKASLDFWESTQVVKIFVTSAWEREVACEGLS